MLRSIFEVRMEKILVLDFGGQYNQLIARRVREHHVYAEIKPYNKITMEEIKKTDTRELSLRAVPTACMLRSLLTMILSF